MSSNDTPISRQEERDMLGEDITEAHFQEVFQKHLKAIDVDDLQSILADHGEAVLTHLRYGAYQNLGFLLMFQARVLAGQRARIKLFGKP